jgi:nitroreductase
MFVDEFVSRNRGIVPAREQAAIMSTRVLVAGCGSVGGSVVPPLVRLGSGSLVLADPDRYETSNLNRQLCVAADVGARKVDVIAGRAKAINPLIEVITCAEGVTPDNVSDLLDGVGIVFDGVETSPRALWSKYLLHQEAAKRRIPVLLGLDAGGQPTVFVWDYRSDPRPFYGKTRADDFREGREVTAVRSYLSPRVIPGDFMPIIRACALTDEPWPQVSYCAAGLGAVVSRTMIDIALGRPVRHIISVDLHQLPRTTPRRVAAAARWPAETARTLWQLRRPGRGIESRAGSPADPQFTGDLRGVLEAIRCAPSGHNAQPWRLRITEDGDVALGWDPSRALPVVDPDGRYISYAIGCAIEAAATVADVSFEPSSPADPREGSEMGVLTINGIHRDRYMQARGLLGARATNRAPFLTESVAPEIFTELEKAVSRFNCALVPFTSRKSIAMLADLTHHAARSNLGDDAFLAELLSWIRLSGDDVGWNEDGFNPETLQLPAIMRPVLRGAKDHPAARRAATKVGLANAMARDAGRVFRASGAAVLVSNPDRSADGRISAGRAVMAAWLAATRAGLAVQPVNFATDSSVTRDAVAEFAGLPPDSELVVLLRLGWPKRPAPSSPRLPLARICASTAAVDIDTRVSV